MLRKLSKSPSLAASGEGETGSLILSVLVAICGIFLLDVMGIIIKLLVERYPTQQLAVFRNIFGLVPCLVLLVLAMRQAPVVYRLPLRLGLLTVLRGGAITFAQVCFYLSLMHLAFATASTLAFAGPMFLTALSVPILGHQVGHWRWSAVLIGFVGVVLVMQPNSDIFTWHAVLPLGAAFGYALSSVLVRLFPPSVPTATLQLYTQLSALAGAVLVLLAGMRVVPVAGLADWGWLLAMGICGGCGVLCLIYAYRRTTPSQIAPFEYFGIPIALVLGWLVFDENPLDRLLPGVLLIILGGGIIIWRERRARP